MCIIKAFVALMSATRILGTLTALACAFAFLIGIAQCEAGMVGYVDAVFDTCLPTFRFLGGRCWSRLFVLTFVRLGFGLLLSFSFSALDSWFRVFAWNVVPGGSCHTCVAVDVLSKRAGA